MYDVSIGINQEVLQAQVECNVLVRMRERLRLLYLATYRTEILIGRRLLHCDIPYLGNSQVMEIISLTERYRAGLRYDYLVSYDQFVDVGMHHSIPVTLLVGLPLVFRVFGLSIEEALICLLVIHVGVGQTLRVSFL